MRRKDQQKLRKADHPEGRGEDSPYNPPPAEMDPLDCQQESYFLPEEVILHQPGENGEGGVGHGPGDQTKHQGH